MVDTEQIRDAVDLVGYAEQHLDDLQKCGQQFRARCCFHEDKTASLYIHPKKQVFHCHGCGAGGDIFRFVELIEGVDFLDACQILAARAGMALKHRPDEYVPNLELVRDREYIAHLAVMRRCTIRHARALWLAATADYKDWVREDLEHAKAITAACVAMLVKAVERGEVAA